MIYWQISLLSAYDFTAIAGMMLKDFLSEGVRVDVRVNLGSTDIFVTEHRLNGAQVGSAFQKGRSKRVTERVRGDGFRDSGLQGLAFDHNQNHCSSEM